MDNKIQGWITSCDTLASQKSRARVGERYAQGQHDILEAKAYFWDSDGNLLEDKYRANFKITHPFFKTLVEQKESHMLSNKGSKVKSDIPALQKELDKYFDAKFDVALSDLIRSVVISGFSYLYMYKDSDGSYSFSAANARDVYEINAKDTDDGRQRILHVYMDGDDKICEEWTDTDVSYWIWTKDKPEWTFDASREVNPRPHLLRIDADGRAYGKSLGFIPWFRMDNNERLESDIYLTKDKIDDYDINASHLSNNLDDAVEQALIITGYPGDDIDMLQQTIKQTKVAGIDGGPNGDVGIHTITTNVPYEARCKKLEIDRSAIFLFGGGYDPELVGDGNVTNVVLKSRFAGLDMSCDRLLKKLLKMLEPILKVVLDDINVKLGTTYDIADTKWDFHREVMSNEVDSATITATKETAIQTRVNTLLNARDLLGDEYCTELICRALDIDPPPEEEAWDE